MFCRNNELTSEPLARILLDDSHSKGNRDQMCAIVCPEFLACSVRVVLDHLRRSATVRCDVRGSKTIRQMLQYLNFPGVQWLAQENLCFVRHLEHPPRRD
jgi:hypothetical protein